MSLNQDARMLKLDSVIAISNAEIAAATQECKAEIAAATRECIEAINVAAEMLIEEISGGYDDDSSTNKRCDVNQLTKDKYITTVEILKHNRAIIIELANDKCRNIINNSRLRVGAIYNKFNVMNDKSADDSAR